MSKNEEGQREGVPGVEAVVALPQRTPESQSQHTPGPWRQGAIREAGMSVPIRSSHYAIADVHSGMDEEWPEQNPEQQANVRLITAAPDLLAACKAIDEFCPCDPDINPRFDAAWRSMLAAIAKAEGRS